MSKRIPKPGKKVVTLAEMYHDPDRDNAETALVEYDEDLDCLVATSYGLYEIERLAQALDPHQIAFVLGLEPYQWDELMESQPDISRIMKRGEARCILDVSSGVIREARQGNLKAAMFYLERRAGWTKHSHGDGEGTTSLEDALESLAAEDESATDE